MWHLFGHLFGTFLGGTNIYKCKGYRLPTEAEWEFAARAGSRDARYGKLDDIAWCKENSGHETHPVSQKQPNAFGLYDMLGNVWEWCHDWYGDYPVGPQTNPQGPSSGPGRVLRGGSYFNYADRVRAAYRNYRDPSYDFHHYYYGFRLARSVKS